MKHHRYLWFIALLCLLCGFSPLYAQFSEESGNEKSEEDPIAAIIDNHKALIIAESERDTALIDLHRSIGTSYQMLNDFENALFHYEKGVNLSDSLNTPAKARQSLICIGNLHAQQGDFVKALPYTRKGVFLSEKYNDSRLQAYGYKEMAYSFSHLGKSDSALFFAQKALDIAEAQQNYLRIAGETYNVLSEIYRKIARYDSAEFAASRALTLSTQIKADKISVAAEHEFVKIYLETGQLKQAANHAREMLETATTANLPASRKEAAELLADIYQKLSDAPAAVKYLQLAGLLSDEIYRKEKKNYLKLHGWLVQMNKKEAENEMLLREITRDRVLLKKSNSFGIVMGLFALLIVIAFSLIYLSRTPISSRPLLSMPFSEHEKEQRLQFVRRLSVIVFLLTIPLVVHSVLWGRTEDIVAKIVFMIMMILMHWLAIKKMLKLIFYLGLFLVYPITVIPSASIGLIFALQLIPVTIFLVWNYLAQRPLEQILNAGALAINFGISFCLFRNLEPEGLVNVEMLDMMVSLMALLLIIVTLIYTNQSVYDSKEELSRNNRFLQQISDLNPHFVFAKDNSRRFIFNNKAMAENFGIHPEELLGKRKEDIHPLFREDLHFSHDDDAVLEKGLTVFRSNEKIMDATGKEKWVSTIKKPIYDENDRIVGILGVASDITERVKAEEQLRQNEAMLNAIIQSIPDPILALKDTLTPIFYNEKQISGYNLTFHELVTNSANNWASLFSPDVISRYQKIIEEVSEGKTIRINDSFNDGEKTTYFSITFAPIIDCKGGYSGILIIIKDETELKQKELDLNRKNDQLKQYIESNMNLENFAYLASHDLRAPIRTVVSFAQLLEKRLKGKIEAEDLEYLNFVVSASKNMQRLIHDLLTYSRVNTAKINIYPLNMPLLLEEIRKELFTAIEEKQAKLTFRNIPDTIPADRIKLRQLFHNLIINALKFHRSGFPPEIEISCVEEPHQWRFWVKDNGIGISSAYQDHIFLLFRRLHKETEYEGTGIGLALCKKIVEQHKGEIGVRSEINKGSEFFFTIPMESAQAKTPVF
ncbi:MAG: PAS domain S-box protein [Bacteroidia bacterium]|nr:PAS domain S-box protein [Bacteroidia bacterium]